MKKRFNLAIYQKFAFSNVYEVCRPYSMILGSFRVRMLLEIPKGYLKFNHSPNN